MAVSIGAVIDKLRREALAEGAPCEAPKPDLQLSDDLYLSGRVAVVEAGGGHKCLDAGEVAEGLRAVAAPATIKESRFKTLSPPYIELYEDRHKYVVLGVYEGKVYMAEWAGIQLCCSWIIDIELDKYKNIYNILKQYLL